MQASAFQSGKYGRGDERGLSANSDFFYTPMLRRDGERKTEQGRRHTEDGENGSAEFKAIQAEETLPLMVTEVFGLPHVLCFSVQLYSELSALNWKKKQTV